jgi:hypothetical protein
MSPRLSDGLATQTSPIDILEDSLASAAGPDHTAAEAVRHTGARVAALAALFVTVVALAWLAVQIHALIADSWVAPLHLSPDNQAIVQLRFEHQRHLAEVARLDAEVTRLDGELAAIGTAVARLSGILDSSEQSMRWQADVGSDEAAGVSSAIANLERQRGLLRQLHERQLGLVAAAKGDLAAGLVDRTALDREEQARDRLALEIADNQRQLDEARRRRGQAVASVEAFRSGAAGAAAGRTRMPEVAAGAEHRLRLDLEILRLQSEARGHRALRAVAAASIATQRGLLAEVEARPLYRAMTQAIDVAFVPYPQLDDVRAGATVLDCTWNVVNCRAVGRVTEVLPGEVVTQDPWGEMARGQYVVLALEERDAIRERVLRVRL